MTVSSLTPGQLAQKRAKDREAQRACQGRKRETFQGLQREVEKLRSLQRPKKGAEALLKENQALKKENQALREELDMLKTSIGLSVNEPLSSMQPGTSCLFIAFIAINLSDELMFL